MQIFYNIDKTWLTFESAKQVSPWSTLVEGDEQPYLSKLLSPSVHEGKHFFVSAVSVLVVKLIYNGVGTVIHLLLLKFFMVSMINQTSVNFAYEITLQLHLKMTAFDQ